MDPSAPRTPVAHDESGFPWPIEVVVAALGVVLVPLALLAAWIGIFAVVGAILGPGAAPFGIVMTALSALYFAALSMWGAGGHS